MVSTKTDLYNLHIANGKIKKITKEKLDLRVKIIDAKGFLMLPGLRDMHIHID